MNYREEIYDPKDYNAVNLYTNSVGSFFKEIYDYFKYRGIAILNVFSTDGIKYNWHFENTPILDIYGQNNSAVEIILNNANDGLIGIEYLQIEESNRHYSCEFIKDKRIEISRLAGSYSDEFGNTVNNYSDYDIDRLILCGENNRLVISKHAHLPSQLRIEVHSGSEVIIGDYAEIKDKAALIAYCNSQLSVGAYSKIGERCNLSVRYDSSIELGKECIIQDDSYVYSKYMSVITLGERSTFEKRTTMISVMDSEISIGNNCMGSFDVAIVGNDGHGLFAYDDTDVYNKSTKTIIGNNVWLGLKATILSGSNIPNNSIIGAGSVVTRSSVLECDSVSVGNPATIVKKGISWERYI